MSRTPKKPTQNRDRLTLAELVLDLDKRLRGGDGLSDVLLPFEEWLALVQQAETEDTQ